MATRLHYSFASPEPVTPSSWSTGWDKTSGATSGYLLLNATDDAGVAKISNAASGTSGHFTAIKRFVSDPVAAQTIAGNIKGQNLCAEVNATDNYTVAVAIKVIAPDGSDRGVLLAITASDDTSATPPEFDATVGFGTNRKLRDSAESASIALASLAVSVGDRIVVELGFRQASTSVANGSLNSLAASYISSDLAENDTQNNTASPNGWIEFDSDISFAAVYYGSSSTPADSSTATGVADPTAVTPPTGMLLGDLVLVAQQERDATTTLTVSNNGGQSWTSETAIGTTNQTARLHWCVFDGTWDANPSFDFAGGTAVNTVVMHVFRPPSTGYTWSVNQAQVELDDVSSPFTITGQTTTGTDPTVTFAGWFTADDNTWGTLSGTGWEVTGTAQYRNTSGTDQSCTFAHKIQTAAGATGNVAKSQLTLGDNDTTTLIITFAAVAPAAPSIPNKIYMRNQAVNRASVY